MANMQVSEMSIKQMKEELKELGGSSEGCCERSDIEARLLEVRGKNASPGHPAAAASGENAIAKFMASMTASFNTMGDSFGQTVI